MGGTGLSVGVAPAAREAAEAVVVPVVWGRRMAAMEELAPTGGTAWMDRRDKRAASVWFTILKPNHS